MQIKANPKISIISAYPASRNTGMLTVDVSCKIFFEKEFPGVDITFYCLARPDTVPYTESELGFLYYDAIENFDYLSDADVIIYWGDFSHSIHHWDVDLVPRMIEMGYAKSDDDAYEIFYKVLFMENFDRQYFEKTIIFGGTILGVSALDQLNSRYIQALDRLILLSHETLFREPISTLRGDFKKDILLSTGTDCACIGATYDWPENVEHRSKQKDTFGFYFNRSKIIVGKLAFIRILSLLTGARPVWLGWIAIPPRLKIQMYLFGFFDTRQRLPASAPLENLLTHDFIVTDTYHICVNALSRGIACATFAKGADTKLHTLQDRKKLVFLEMFGANSLLIFEEHLINPYRLVTECKRIRKTIYDKAFLNQVKNNIFRHTEKVKTRLKMCVSQILNPR